VSYDHWQAERHFYHGGKWMGIIQQLCNPLHFEKVTNGHHA